MRRLIALLLALAPVAAGAETVAIVHARAYTNAAPTPVENATIVMTDGRIVSVIAAAPPPQGARVIDAGGRPVTPGLMNPATQLGLVEIAGARDTDDRSAGDPAIGPAFDIRAAINPNELALAKAQADGVARAMTYPGGTAVNPFAGQGALLRLDGSGDPVERGRAAMFVAMDRSPYDDAGGSHALRWGLLRGAIGEARAYAAAPRTPAQRDQRLSRADVEALQPVIAGRMPLVIEAHRESDIREAIRLATEEKLRVVILGGAEAWRLGAALAAARIPVILDPFANLPASYDSVGARLDNAALLATAGVTIAFTVPGNGIDLSYNAGSALREGAGLAVANGLSAADALAAITLNPARIWGIADHYGQLAAGQDADVVIWDGDPLEPATAPAAVFVRGREVARVTRQTLLRDRYAPARAADPMPPAYR